MSIILNAILKNKKVEQIPLTVSSPILHICMRDTVAKLNLRNDIEHIIFPYNIPVSDYNIRTIESLHFVTRGEIHVLARDLLIHNLHPKQNYYLHVDDPNTKHINLLKECFKDTNLHILNTNIGRCHSTSQWNRDCLIAVDFDIEKYRKLKNFKNILWYGKYNHGRIHVKNPISQKYNIKEVSIDFSKQKILDVMIENQCFCVLSLDGSAHQCYRDVELGLGRVFNLRHTSADFDISANGGIYLARSHQEIFERINEIRQDISNENYVKLDKAFDFFKGTTNIINIINKRPCVHPHQHPFYSINQVEAISRILSLDINSLLSSKEVHEMSTAQEWENIVNKFLSTV